MHRSIPVRSALVSVLAAVGLVAVPPAAGAAALTCGGSPAPTFGASSPNSTLNTRFANYGNSNTLLDDWTGADSTYSVKLPDGRIVYGFSDTFLGRINAGSPPSRSPITAEGGTTPFLNNTFVVQSTGGSLTTAHGGTAAAPTALLPPNSAGHIHWAADMTMNGSQLQQPYRTYSGGGWNAKFEKNVLAKFSTTDLRRPTSVTELPSATGTMWGSALLKDGGYTYIYGTEDRTATEGKKYLRIARVPGTDLSGSWEYLTAKSPDPWSSVETESIRVMSGVSNEFSVTRRGNFYIMINQDTKQPFSAEIDAHLSCSAFGPFTDERTVHYAIVNGSDPDMYSYNAHAHASLSSTNNLVVSYNVNSLDETPGPTRDVYRDATIYRPRFVNIPVTG